ncbi:MAG: 2-succinyl-5-enolpyruvyl-6-hydroxy-3-cyclohexene-1-carboxylic-acid synthase [Candidatus Competibacteraceae bacterium]
MPLDNSNINTLWSSLLIEELARNGIDYCCISSGSRSAPLTVAAARHPRMRTLLCLDERGAAFHALGYARAAGRPAVLLCTSGTAAANYLPAVIEAAMDRLPLLVLSADRPPELQETGANQTIRQRGLFGVYAKWEFELPCPEETIAPSLVLTTLDQALYQARNAPCGPVHLNIPFREPLAPISAPVAEHYCESLGPWLSSQAPFTVYSPRRSLPSPEAITDIARLLAQSTGLIVIGRLESASARKAVIDLLQRLQWPVVADITSGLRLGVPGVPLLPYFDQLLLSPRFRAHYRPAVVLHIGGQIVSKRLPEFIQQLQPPHYIAIKDHPFRYDPNHQFSRHWETDIAVFCQAVLEQSAPQLPAADTRTLLDLSTTVGEVIDGFSQAEQVVSEITVARLLSAQLPAGHGLWLASSMPIRDMDMVGGMRESDIPIGANRGTSGIEGGIAAATGFATGLQTPVTVVIGDLAFLHDLNSLALLKKIRQPLIIILINNNGGGIFSFLPIAGFADVFEDYFGTPHGFGFQAAAQLFGIDYRAPKTNGELLEAYRTAVATGRSTLIEIVTDRRENYELHQALQSRIVARIEQLLA